MHRVPGFTKPASELHTCNMHHETQKSMHASPRVSTCVRSLNVRTSLSATYTQAPTHNHISRYLLNVHESSNLSRRPFPDEMRSFDFIWQMHASVHAVTRTHANEIVFAAVQEHTGKQDSYAAAVSRCTFEPLGSTRGPFGYSCVPQRAIGSAYALLRSNYAYKLLGFSAVQTNTLSHLWSALFFLFSFSPLPRLSVWVSSERSSIDGTTLITTGGRSVCLSIFSMERSHPTHA